MNARGRPGERGSVVIEAMVAALLIAALAAALFRTLAGDAQAARATMLRQRALLVARSVLDAADAAGPPDPGVRDGSDGALDWRMAVTPYPAGASPSGAGPVARVMVSVRLAGSQRPLATLASLRFAR